MSTLQRVLCSQIISVSYNFKHKRIPLVAQGIHFNVLMHSCSAYNGNIIVIIVSMKRERTWFDNALLNGYENSANNMFVFSIKR